MSIDHVLAVVPVSDIDVALHWYYVLVARPEENHHMYAVVDLRVTETDWLQVLYDPERAGSTLLNFAVDWKPPAPSTQSRPGGRIVPTGNHSETGVKNRGWVPSGSSG